MTFASVYVNLVVSPVLVQLAGEFGVSAGIGGLVVAAYGVPGIVVGVLAGPLSDRYGRKPFLVGGTLILGAFTAAGAFAPSFALLVLARSLAGFGAAVIAPNVNALVGDSFPYRERGRAMSTIIGMNTLASIVGVPLAGIVSDATTWRVSLGAVGLLAVAAAVTLLLTLPHTRPPGDSERARALYRRIVTDRSAVATIISSSLGALYWFSWVTYLVVFFVHQYALSQGVASTIALTMGLGVLIGSRLGGRLGDRFGHRPIVAGSILGSAALLLALTNLAVPLPVAALLNLGLSAIIGARFATNTALLTEQVPEARGTMLSVAASVQSLGIVSAAIVGGLLIDGPGFGALGVFCAVVAVLSSATVILFVTEEPLDLESTPA